jgi:hypothetical protein
MLEYAVLHVIGKEPSRIIPRQAIRRLGQVVGSEGVEIGHRCDLMGQQGGPGDLDHGSHFIADLDPVALQDLFRDPHRHIAHHAQFLHVGDERDHDLGDGLDLLPGHLTGGFHDGLDLHLVDFRIGDPEPAPSVAQHGIELVQRLVPRL